MESDPLRASLVLPTACFRLGHDTALIPVCTGLVGTQQVLGPQCGDTVCSEPPTKLSPTKIQKLVHNIRLLYKNCLPRAICKSPCDYSLVWCLVSATRSWMCHSSLCVLFHATLGLTNQNVLGSSWVTCNHRTHIGQN